MIAVLINAIVWIILVLLAVIGLSAVIRGISHALLCSGLPQCCCTVAVLYGNEADVTMRAMCEMICNDYNITLCDEYSLKYELKTLCNNSKTD